MPVVKPGAGQPSEQSPCSQQLGVGFRSAFFVSWTSWAQGCSGAACRSELYCAAIVGIRVLSCIGHQREEAKAIWQFTISNSKTTSTRRTELLPRTKIHSVTLKVCGGNHYFIRPPPHMRHQRRGQSQVDRASFIPLVDFAQAFKNTRGF